MTERAARVVTYSDGRGALGTFYATVELEDGARIFVQIVKQRPDVFVKVARRKWTGLVDAEVLYRGSDMLEEFVRRGPPELTAMERSREVLRRLTQIVLDCETAEVVRRRLADVAGAGLFDNAKWSDAAVDHDHGGRGPH